MATRKRPLIGAKGAYADREIGSPTYAASTAVEQAYAKAGSRTLRLGKRLVTPV